MLSFGVGSLKAPVVTYPPQSDVGASRASQASHRLCDSARISARGCAFALSSSLRPLARLVELLCGEPTRWRHGSPPFRRAKSSILFRTRPRSAARGNAHRSKILPQLGDVWSRPAISVSSASMRMARRPSSSMRSCLTASASSAFRSIRVAAPRIRHAGDPSPPSAPRSTWETAPRPAGAPGARPGC